jgi:aminopeptidase-like protein
LNVNERQNGFDPLAEGQAMYRLISELYPICRSITGDGLRQTLRVLQAHIPLEVREVPTGTQVFDWTVPKEWNIHDAYVKNPSGERVIDFQKSNLHVVSYSMPVHSRMPLAALKEHLFSLPAHPDWIPYRTSYYKENWGFCLSERHLAQLKDEEYEVCIDSTLEDGHLSYGEFFLSPVALQRQPVRHCSRSVHRQVFKMLIVALFLSLSFHPRHNRRYHLACPE